MKVFGHPWSINTRKILVAFAEKGARVELELVDLPTAKQHTPEHRARHPFAKVPVLEDDGWRLYESNAILRYVAATLPGPALVPQDAKQAARMDQWLSIASGYFGEPALALAIEAIFKRVRGIGEPDPATMQRLVDTLGTSLDVADRELARQRYLAGDELSLADLAWMPSLEYLWRLRSGRALIEQREHVSGWWKQLAERPSWTVLARTGAQHSRRSAMTSRPSASARSSSCCASGRAAAITLTDDQLG
jgi:glutathione S-transferase